jgi:predicted MPP superfamily phosphohydrolase
VTHYLKNHKRIRIIVIIIVAIAAVLLIYGFLIEPKMLLVRHFSVDLEGGNFAELSETEAENETPDSRLKIVTIADLHIGYGTPISYVNKLVEKVNKETPDVILFTGDLKTRSEYLDKREAEAVAALSKLTAKYGKFAVYGNHDTFARYPDIMEASGFTLLTNSGQTLDINGEEVFIGGVNSLSLSPRPDKMLSTYNDPDIAIILAHEPDLALEFQDKTDNVLILSGHMHGGQIDIPFLTRWWITSGGKGNLMVDGFYENGDNTVFVSTGIGMSVMPMRFRVPPQVEVIYVK